MSATRNPNSVEIDYNGIGSVPANVSRAIIHSNLIEIPMEAFYYRSILQSVEFPKQLKSVGERAFAQCSSLRKVVLPTSLVAIERGAFTHCTSLEKVDFSSSSSLTLISQAAFSNCKSLPSIAIPASVVRIDRAAFSRCEALKTVQFAASDNQLTVIGAISFAGCTSLQAIRLPSTLKELHVQAFGGCTALISVEIPSSLQHIAPVAFSSCENLKSLAIPSAFVVVEEETMGAFDGCQQLRQDHFRRGFVLSEAEVPHVLQNRFEELPIHHCCYYQQFDKDIISDVMETLKQEMLKLRPSDVLTDIFGMTPLHLLALSKSKHAVDLAKLLLQDNGLKSIVATKDNWNCLAMHYACLVDAPMPLVRLFMDAHNSIHSPLPWKELIQRCFSSSVTLLRYMVRLSIRDRVQRLYNFQWKSDVTFLIYQISKDMEKEAKQAHVESIFHMLACFERRETMALLELALWKAVIDTVTIVGVDEYPTDDQPNTDDLEKRQRQNCRVMCGADIIIANVSPFMGPVAPFSDMDNETIIRNRDD